MLEKLKSIGANLTSWVILTLTAIFIFILYLLSRISGLKSIIASMVSRKSIEDGMKLKEGLHDEADKAESDYRSSRDYYVKLYGGSDNKDKK